MKLGEVNLMKLTKPHFIFILGPQKKNDSELDPQGKKKYLPCIKIGPDFIMGTR